MEAGAGVRLSVTVDDASKLSCTLSRKEFARFEDALLRAKSFLLVPIDVKLRAFLRPQLDRLCQVVR